VDVFFVLSGYLITQLLLSEWQVHGGINLAKFYVRRGLRLYPALLGLLLAYLLFSPELFPAYANDAPRDTFVAALYLSDYSRAFWKFPVLIGHTWSLSVEEHFYVLWPLALLFLLHRLPIKQCARVMFAAFLALSLWRALSIGLGQTWGEVYYRFDTRASGLSLGCAYALWAHGRESTNKFLLPWLGGALIAAAMIIAPKIWQLTLTAGFTAVEIGTVLVIHGLATRGVAKSILSTSPLAYLGRISYGVYLWHYPIVTYFYAHGFGFAAAFLGGGLLTWAAAAASYATIESLPRRLSAHLKAGGPLPKWLRLGRSKSIEQRG
jgi:peptidoglycan/LPS O-acetylase OafA/YrhL